MEKQGIWQKRLTRGYRLASIQAILLRQALHWHLLGGRHFFSRYWQELAASRQWCFIVGCNNSGTTLLHDLLARAPGVSTLANEGQIYTRALKRAERRGAERVWSEFIEEIRCGEQTGPGTAPRLVHDWMEAFGPGANPWLLEKTTANAVACPGFSPYSRAPTSSASCETDMPLQRRSGVRGTRRSAGLQGTGRR